MIRVSGPTGAKTTVSGERPRPGQGFSDDVIGCCIALPATPCPKAGGSRGSRAGRRPIPQGRAAPLTRGHAGPYQRPPPTRPRYAQHGRAIPLATGRVATTARIRHSTYGTKVI